MLSTEASFCHSRQGQTTGAACTPSGSDKTQPRLPPDRHQQEVMMEETSRAAPKTTHRWWGEHCSHLLLWAWLRAYSSSSLLHP